MLLASSIASTHWISKVEHGLLVSSVAYTHWLVYVERVLSALCVTYTHRSTYIECGLLALAIACTHGSVDIGQCQPASAWTAQIWYGMWESGNWCQPMECGVSYGLYARAWNVHIWQATSANGTSTKICLHRVTCAHLASDISQRHAASSKTFMHQSGRVT